MQIKNGLVFGADGKFHPISLYSVDGRVVERSAWEKMGQGWGADSSGESQGGFHTWTAGENSRCIDAAGLYVIPGLVDVHAHGAMGHDFCDGDVEGLRKIAEYEYQSGVLSDLDDVAGGTACGYLCHRADVATWDGKRRQRRKRDGRCGCESGKLHGANCGNPYGRAVFVGRKVRCAESRLHRLCGL